ncbi:MAG: hypothetical protein HN952_08395 [Candidatus Cloacimonetes bacterium]|jgi:predicted phosphodiesterase|nr:hypothetical protein [Candidatus Cloacimonadota bacterium]MBT6994954.1 hypothetical protein [Candidatus Cloacimonadota bacterium]
MIKKIFLILVLLTIIFITIFATVGRKIDISHRNVRTFYGDIDSNNEITAYDASLVIQYAIGLISGWSNEQQNAADVDGNGMIQTYDASLILQYTLNLIDIFPIQEFFVIYGDTRTDRYERTKVAECIDVVDPGYVFMTGDFCDPGYLQEMWDLWFEDCGIVLENREFCGVRGNHDKSTDSSATIFLDNVGEYIPSDANWDGINTWYSIDRKEIHFIVIDSYVADPNVDLAPESAQYEWLIDNLENIDDNIKAIVMLLHHPPYGTSRHQGHEPYLREHVVPLINEYDIKFVFSGHNHSYERLLVDDVNYIVTAGGGAPLYAQETDDDDMQYSQLYLQEYHFCKMDIVDNLITIDVVDTNFVIIDHVELELE